MSARKEVIIPRRKEKIDLVPFKVFKGLIRSP